MRQLSGWVVAALVLWCGNASAVEIKNVRATYGPFGAERSSAKLLPGEVIMINYDLQGLTTSAKNGLVKWNRTLQVSDAKGKVIDTKTEEKGLFVGLGGDSVPDFVVVAFGTDLTPGKYKVKVTVTDPGNKTTK